MIIISSIILILSVIYFLFKLKKNGVVFSEAYYSKLNIFKYRSTSDTSNKLGRFRITILYFTILLFIFMLLSSFIPTMFTLEHLTGLFLVIHVTIAPIFAITLTMIILFYSYRLKLDNSDYTILVNRKNNETNFTIIKLAFWLVAFFSIPLLLSIILILFPILGTDMQDMNVTIHRISALIFTIFTLVLLYYILIINKRNHSK